MIIRRVFYRGFSLVELLVAIMITMIGISACFKMLQVINVRAYSLSDREGFEAASNAATQIADDIEKAGIGIRSLGSAWLCHLLSQDQFNRDHYTLLAPFFIVQESTPSDGPNPWIRSDVIMSEYSSYYPYFPTRIPYSTSDGYQITLDSIDETNFDPAVGMLTKFQDSAATSGFGRPCIMTQKTAVKTAGNYYYFASRITGPLEYTFSPDVTQNLFSNRTDELDNYMPSWARQGAMTSIHPEAWNMTDLVRPSAHTVISPHVPNFIAWSVEPQTGFLRRKNMLNNSDGGCISDLVVSIRGQYLVRDGTTFQWKNGNKMSEFLTGSGTNPASMVPPVDFSKVIAIRIIVLARNGTYFPDTSYLSPTPSWEAGQSFDMGPTVNSMPGSGVTVRNDQTDWRHYEWEVAQYIIPLEPVTGWTYTK